MARIKLTTQERAACQSMGKYWKPDVAIAVTYVCTVDGMRWHSVRRYNGLHAYWKQYILPKYA